MFSFNHKSSTATRFPSEDPVLPKYVLALHSSKPIALEYCDKIEGLLADTVIQLALNRGEENNVRSPMKLFCHKRRLHYKMLLIVRSARAWRATN